MADDVISKTDKNRIAGMSQIDSLFLMLFLLDQFHTQRQAASKELIMAICWEESFFQNIRQVGGPAVGYGQLERDGRRIANQHLTGNFSSFSEGAFSAQAVLSSRETSISAVSHCLAGLVQVLGDQTSALNAYAGVRARPVNAGLPPRWRDCERALQQAITPGTPLNPPAIEDALRKARDFERSGPVYDHIHNRLFPLLDIITQLVNRVQIGSQGSQVMILQDSLNRLPASDGDFLMMASLPLTVDGMFGPKTNERVKSFQGQNNLTADGIVGPMTRSVLQSVAQSLTA